jgi:hypothetical protein
MHTGDASWSPCYFVVAAAASLRPLLLLLFELLRPPAVVRFEFGCAALTNS